MRDGLKIKQAEWNIVKIGNSAHAGKCIKARYKNIRMETTDNNSARTISIMSNGVIDVSCSGLSHIQSTLNAYWQILENLSRKFSEISVFRGVTLTV